MSFWDLVKLKLKYGKNKLKTTYDIIDDYTLLYSNMSKLLEHFVTQHSTHNNSNVSHNRVSWTLFLLFFFNVFFYQEVR